MRVGDMSGYPDVPSPTDIIDHPDMNLPDPGHSPRPVHGVQMAGDVIPFPITMQGSDSQRMTSMAGQDSGRIKPKPARIIAGPGSNK